MQAKNEMEAIKSLSKKINEMSNIDKGILPNGKSFNDVYAEGNSCVYAISGSYNQSTLPGFPTGAYNYGTLLTFNPRKVSSESNTWDLSQIYIPDQPADRGIYFRSRRTSNWLKIEGTAVAPIM